jgi:protein-L-isoaspartate(D-aspartate) O-methyltransferase
MSTLHKQREQMVARQIAARGVHDERVLAAMRTVPRERFVPESLQEFAYDDAPLPIEEGQTISQPYIVAVMIEALELQPTDRVLEVGAGSGYASAVLSRCAAQVFGVEFHAALANLARDRMQQLAYDNAQIICGDGTLGWPEQAPFDAILVSAGGPAVPQSLLEQLKIGGRLVIPSEMNPTQELLRIDRTGEHAFARKSLGRVQFVPLVGTEGWSLDGMPVPSHRDRRPLRITKTTRSRLTSLISDACEPFDEIESADLQPLLSRIGPAKIVLIGEASHGTSEFYRMRARITRELVTHLGFHVVAIEGDWPDTRMIDRYVRGQSGPRLRPPFSRFPTWMWRNQETRAFVDWLFAHNSGLRSDRQVSLHGLDVYSLNNSIGAVLDYLRRVDPVAAETARIRYGCFSPWETDPATYGRAAVSRRIRDCEQDAIATLTELLSQRMDYLASDGESFFDAERNATVVRNAEQYYRTMYYGSRESWNLRDRHMFDTLQAVLKHRGADAKAVVWAHNTHVGNAAATEMGIRGEFNIGQLAREAYGTQAYSIGFGTHHGTVAAASNWDEPMQIMSVRPSHPDSYERVCHDTGIASFLLPLRESHNRDVRSELLTPHLERAIGVIYRPETEVPSHYFHAALPAQFDEYIWFDRTSAVKPLEVHQVAGVPETYLAEGGGHDITSGDDQSPWMTGTERLRPGACGRHRSLAPDPARGDRRVGPQPWRRPRFQ